MKEDYYRYMVVEIPILMSLYYGLLGVVVGMVIPADVLVGAGESYLAIIGVTMILIGTWLWSRRDLFKKWSALTKIQQVFICLIVIVEYIFLIYVVSMLFFVLKNI